MKRQIQSIRTRTIKMDRIIKEIRECSRVSDTSKLEADQRVRRLEGGRKVPATAVDEAKEWRK